MSLFNNPRKLLTGLIREGGCEAVTKKLGRAVPPKLSIFYTAAICVIVILLLLALRRSICATDAASIREDRVLYTMGNVPEGGTIRHSFKIKNDTNREIAITEVTQGCGCTSIALSKQKLRPGEVTVVELSVNTKGIEGSPNASGNIFWIYPDQKLPNVLKVGIVVHVLNILHISQSVVDFGVISDNDPIQDKTVVLSRGELMQPWDSLALHQEGNNIRVTLKKINADKYELRLLVDPANMPIGHFGDRYTIDCKSGGNVLSEHFTITVSGLIDSDLKLEPASIYFGVVPPNEITKKRFKISCNQPISLQSIRTVGSSNAVINPLVYEGKQISFDCSFDSSRLHGDQSGKFLVTLKKGKESKSLVIPYIVYVR